jgi:Family of unknown function (DUF6886)
VIPLVCAREERAHPAPPLQPSGYGGTPHVSVAAAARVHHGGTEAAPPYRGEGPRALWHVSEDDSIRRFEPHRAPTSSLDEPLVWAIDTRHLPLYWFPRACPRATFWASSTTTGEDVVRFLDGDRDARSHVVEPDWLGAMRLARVVAYRLPAETFEPWDRFWISRTAVEPLELLELGDLVERHERAGIGLTTAADLLAVWQQVIASSLDYSGIRLRNARMAR